MQCQLSYTSSLNKHFSLGPQFLLNASPKETHHQPWNGYSMVFQSNEVRGKSYNDEIRLLT